MRPGEMGPDTVKRILQTALAAFASHVNMGASEMVTEWKESDTFGVRTKYLRDIYTAWLDCSPVGFIDNFCERVSQHSVPIDDGVPITRKLRSALCGWLRQRSLPDDDLTDTRVNTTLSSGIRT